jgi:hypothetical protein
MHLLVAPLVLALACASTKPSEAPVNPAVVTLHPGDVAFTGMCDASGAVPLGGARFAVADDEDNVLRVYDAERGGAPVATIDVSAEILPVGVPGLSPNDEADLEGATRIGNVAFWITSHARTKDGHRQPSRLRFFATTAPETGEGMRVLGSTDRLLDAMLAEPRFAHLGLAAAAALAPTAPTGLNIEGLGRRVDEGVWIAFRNPIIDGKALLIGLLNPLEVINGEPARFVDPVLLDLGGLGIRSMSLWHGSHPIIAGHPAHGARSKLYTWDEKSSPRLVSHVDLSGYNAEAFVSLESREKLMLLSDDGSVEISGERCKRLRDPSRKAFHGRWVSLTE